MRLFLALLATILTTACTVDLGFPLADRGEKIRKPLDYDPPANLPPENYVGDVWVDREGCIFLRTAQNNWIPQVNQKRIQVCDKAAMLAYLDRTDPRVSNRPSEPVRESALNVQQALAVVSIDNPKPAPEALRDAPKGAERSYIQVDPAKDAPSFSIAQAKFKERKIPVFSSDRAKGVIVLGPFTKGLDVQDALVTAWSFGFLEAYPFKQ